MCEALIQVIESQVRLIGGGRIKRKYTGFSSELDVYIPSLRIGILFDQLPIHEQNLLIADGLNILYAKDPWYVENGILLRCIEKISQHQLNPSNK